MSGFTGDWLAAREPADLRARNADVRAAFRDHLGETLQTRANRPLTVLDLGAGTGATMRALAPHLGMPVRWRLAEHDPALIALARDLARRDGFEAEVVEADLSQGVSGGLLDGVDAVTTSAFLDLVSADWLDELARTLRRAGLPFLAMLTYDGRQSLDPEHPFDETVRAAMAAHQGGDKGFGAALGPAAHAHAAASFRMQGYRVVDGLSDWRALPEETVFQTLLVEGWAQAARETGAGADEIDNWLALRLAQVADARLVARVGHRDLAALPG
ncbi:class I SAM-dependent methyltransferase [Stappia sp. MMSF_3263]|uniref:methyltransferase domain-containing protein n=1 Tax=Stappia sp. MMSF_3263 TaxID=3046693 RepID=UPI00273E740F|nr:class I SAM-dependent methyltransferase [Stappia sp. MMSF_3263]